MINLEEKAHQLAEYIMGLPDFQILSQPDGNYHHMGATLTDAVLQAGISYERTVKPRVQNLLKNYPEAKTTSGFLALLEEIPPQKLLKFKGHKPELIKQLALFFQGEGVETQDDLAHWFIKDQENKKRLMKFPYVKEKTADYLAILVGISDVAVDRHLRTFLQQAGIDLDDYDSIKKVVEITAALLNLDKSVLDHNIWKYVSSQKRKEKS